ncbi:MAG: VanZ family protein [Gallionella sp.]|nr:VanZ family protein [Gallionella sp.]
MTLKYHRVWLAAGWLMAGLIVYLSLMPMPPTPLTFDHSDKLEHAFAYASLSYWLCQIYLSARSRLVVITAIIGLGVALEYVQGWTGYRSFDVMDMWADSAGALIGWGLACTPLGRLLSYIENCLRPR